MKISILDDEPLAVDLLKRYVEKTEGLEVLATYFDPFKALEDLPENPPDVLFLDMRMPEIEGYQVLEKLGSARPLAVVTSAFPEYSVDGYKRDIFDYLVKPFSYASFLQTVERLKKRVGEESFYIQGERRNIRVTSSEIEVIESDGDYIRVFYKDGRSPLPDIRLPLRSMEAYLPSGTFLRVHKSFLVNKNEIKYLEGDEIMMKNGKAVPLGRTYRSSIKKQIRDLTIFRKD